MIVISLLFRIPDSIVGDVICDCVIYTNICHTVFIMVYVIMHT